MSREHGARVPAPRILAFFCNFPPEAGAASVRNAELIRSIVFRLKPERVQVVYFDLLANVRDHYVLADLGSVAVSRIGASVSFLPWAIFPWFNPFASLYFLSIALVWIIKFRASVVIVAVPPYPLAPVALLARVCGAHRVLLDAHDSLGKTIYFVAKERG